MTEPAPSAGLPRLPDTGTLGPPREPCALTKAASGAAASGAVHWPSPDYEGQLRAHRSRMYAELAEELPRVTPPLNCSLIGGGELLRVANPANGRFTVVMTTEVNNRVGRAWGYFWQGNGQAWRAAEAAWHLARWLG